MNQVYSIRMMLALAATLLSFPCLTHGDVSRPNTELVQSVPLETNIGHPDLRHAQSVWVEMIRSAKKTLDIGQMYVSYKEGEALTPVVRELERAGARGVRIRLILSANMLESDPVALERFKQIRGLEWVVYDLKQLTGGIIHSKHWLIDGKKAYIGSQNLDWKSLSHIHELGVLTEDRAVVEPLTRIFEADWTFATTGKLPSEGSGTFNPVKPGKLELVASPPILNPPGIRSALEALLELIQGAKKKIRIQLLNYSKGSTGSEWTDIDDALRAAARRGVTVELLVSDWNTARPGIDHLKSLSQVRGISVKIATIPEHSSGYISYARVIHSKYMTVDGRTLWLGTSNWSRGYFHASRNVEIITRDVTLVRQADQIFGRIWPSSYAAQIDINRNYEPPRRD